MQSLEQRFWAKVAKGDIDECWRWTGCTDAEGYGRIRVGRVATPAHRVAHLLAIGPIPDGYQVDHTCHSAKHCVGGPGCPHRACVNPAHLQAVTPLVNTRRAHDGRPPVTHCPAGHAYTADNTRHRCSPGGKRKRSCRECERARDRVRYALHPEQWLIKAERKRQRKADTLTNSPHRAA